MRPSMANPMAGQTQSITATKSRGELRSPVALVAYELLVVVPVVGILAALLIRDPGVLEAELGWWVALIALTDLLPVRTWRGLQMVMDFPLLIAVALLYEPAAAGAALFVASFDPREFKGEVGLLRALFNRSQMAASAFAASAVFHELGSLETDLASRVIPALLAVIAAYTLNTGLVAIGASLLHRIPLPRVVSQLRIGHPSEFLVSYLGLGALGVLLAELNDGVGIWAVTAVIVPVVLVRQMFFRSLALEDAHKDLQEANRSLLEREQVLETLSRRLTEQNTLLAEQATRLERHLAIEQKAVAELRELNRMKEEFVAVVSHELRTPLTAIIGMTKTFRRLDMAADRGAIEEFVETMERRTEHLSRLVENLLSASHVQSDRVRLMFERVAFGDLCREVLDTLGVDAKRVRIDLPVELPPLITDRGLLGRVLSNLLDNALKYSPRESTCEVGVVQGGDSISFWVRDRGIGIPVGEHERIFDPFYQVDSSTTRAFSGLGLGLSLVRDLVHQLDGTIEVESAPGAGSTFTVTLPLVHPAAERSTALSATPGAGITATPAEGGRGIIG
jgi:signal transduction histidine kinase